MRWFKHLTRSHLDESMLKLKGEFGPTGYGVYWTILEKIAMNMEGEGSTSLEISVKSWAKSCEISPKKFQKIAEFLSKLGCVTTELSGQNLKIDCPKLLKYKDEYMRKSGQRKQNDPDKVPTKNRDRTETEIETETETEDKIPPAPKPKRTAPKNSTPTNPDIKVFIHWYFQEHLARFKTKVIINGQDAAHVKRLLGTVDLAELKARAVRFFDDGKSWPDGDKSLRYFAQNVNRYIPKADQRGGRPDDDFDAMVVKPEGGNNG